MKLTIGELDARFRAAKAARQFFESDWDDCYRYAFPSRASWFSPTPGENRSRDIFDATAVDAVQEFASAMAFGLTPTFSTWFRLEPGPLSTMGMTAAEIQKLQQQLDDVTAYVFSVIDGSNFQPANHEVFADLSIGWSNLWVTESDDPTKVIEFNTVPQRESYIDLGPGARPDGRFREYKVEPKSVKILYPGAKDPGPEDNADPDKTEICIVDAVYRDWDEMGTEVWHRAVFQPGSHRSGILWERTYKGPASCPVISPRWSTTAFEAYGRGPLFNSIADIRVLNLVAQLTLENAEMAIAGMWQADDDGIINFDTINLLPGTVVPVDPESRGLQPLSSPGRFDVSNFVIESWRQSIRRALFNVDLGPTNKTPMSATEAAERQSQLARRIGAPFSRLMVEYLNPLVRRVTEILKKANKIELPEVNGKAIQVVSRSPLARAQKQEAIMQLQQFDATAKQLLGQQALGIYNDDGLLTHLSALLETPQQVLSTAEQRQQIQQAALAMAQGSQAPGNGVPTP